MKKFKLKVLLPLVAIAAMGVGSFTAFNSETNANVETALLLENVEALARVESGWRVWVVYYHADRVSYTCSRGGNGCCPGFPC